MSNFRRRLMQRIKRKEYTELEYIESTGTQYIDTNFIPNSNTDIEIVCECIDNKFLFGSRKSTTGTSQQRFAFYLQSLGAKRQTNPQFNNTNILDIYNAYDLSKKNTVKFGKNGFWQNDIQMIDLVKTYGEFTGEYSMYLLNCNTANTVSSLFEKAKIYACKIYDNDVLVRDFIPVLDKTNVACLYDKVNKEYYYNAGTGEFLY